MRIVKIISIACSVSLSIACAKSQSSIESQLLGSDQNNQATNDSEQAEEVSTLTSNELNFKTSSETIKNGTTCTKEIKDSSVQLLKKYNQEGYLIYSQDKESYFADAWWTDCTQSLDSIVVSIHETVHALSKNVYPLLSGRTLNYTDDNNLFKPSLLKGVFKEDQFVDIYLKEISGSTSSATNFSILLDEFNAYTHGLNTATKLSKSKAPHQWRDGALAMMSFVNAYINRAKNNDSKAWQALQKNDLKQTIKTIWKQAEVTLKKSCEHPSSLGGDKEYSDYLCTPSNTAATEELLGQKISCPKGC